MYRKLIPASVRDSCIERRLVFSLVAAYFVYIILGGLVFHTLELPQYKNKRKAAKEDGKRWLEEHKCVSRPDLEALVLRVAKELQYGDISLQNDSMAPNWDIPSSIFFASTVVTTIGYGHIAPATHGGKIFCVFYALFGIPLTGIMLAAIGDRITKALSRLQRHRVCIQRPRVGAAIQSLVLFGGGMVLFLSLPAVMFWQIEGWSYWEAWYYSFITLSTIGFGDFVVGIKADQYYQRWYRLATAVWILLGLAWLACVVASLTECLKSRIEQKLKITHNYNENNMNSGEGSSTSQNGSLHLTSIRSHKEDLSPSVTTQTSPS